MGVGTRGRMHGGGWMASACCGRADGNEDVWKGCFVGWVSFRLAREGHACFYNPLDLVLRVNCVTFVSLLVPVVAQPPLAKRELRRCIFVSRAQRPRKIWRLGGETSTSCGNYSPC